MATLIDYLNGLLGHTTQTFGQNGETGVDIAVPYGSPVYALTPGTVVGAGYYGGGGVETIASQVHAPNYTGAANVYYQHLSTNLLTPGEQVHTGQLIGYSGGQLGYGNHPSSAQYSSGPHIEIGLNAPYGGMWGTSPGPNVNPVPFLQGLASNAQSTAGSVNQAVASGILMGLGLSPLQATSATGLPATSPTPPTPQALLQQFTTSATGGLKLAGWFVIALAVMGAGLWLLIPDETKQQAASAIKGAVKTGAEVAAA